jgi:hypothetical protein
MKGSKMASFRRIEHQFQAEKPPGGSNKADREHQQCRALNTFFAGPSNRADRFFGFFSASVDGCYLVWQSLDR